MKTFMILVLLGIFSISGCTDFIAPSDREEARASRPSPADISTKSKNQETGVVRDSSKAALSLPSK